MSDQQDLLTVEDICVACELERDWLMLRVTEGLIPASGNAPEWRFTTTTLVRVRRMREIERTYDAAPELAALVADMLEQMDDLRARLKRAGLD